MNVIQTTKLEKIVKIAAAVAFIYFLIGILRSTSIFRKEFFEVEERFIYFLIFILYFLCLCLLRLRRNLPSTYNQIFILYMIWIAICYAKGILIYSEKPSDYIQMLSASTILLGPLFIPAFSDVTFLRIFYQVWLKWAKPFCYLAPVWLYHWGNEQFMGPLLTLTPFVSAWSRKARILVIIFLLYLILFFLGDRTMVLRSSFILGLVLISIFFKNITTTFFSITQKIFLFLPVLFIMSGMFGSFNLFKIGDYFDASITIVDTDKEGNKVESNVFQDSRTNLYKDVWNSATKHDYVLAGRSPARGHDVSIESFRFLGDVLKYGRNGERHSDEMVHTNVFTWTGIIGLFLYSFFFWHSSWLAVHYSNNIYSKIIGCIVASRWMMGWIEEIGFLVTSISWIFIGLAYAPAIRRKTNIEIKQFFASIKSKNESANS